MIQFYGIGIDFCNLPFHFTTHQTADNLIFTQLFGIRMNVIPHDELTE